MENTKYVITDIAHSQYPFLHRIRALRDIGDKVKAGDLGGFVEREQNLSFEPGDDAWLFDESICCNEARLDKGSILKDYAQASGRAYITGGAAFSCTAKAADNAYVCGARLSFGCMALGNSIIAPSRNNQRAPMLGGEVAVYGRITGDVRVAGRLVVLENERISNSTMDILNICSGARTMILNESRGILQPLSRKPARAKTRADKIISMAR